jgi:hypothetical protein
VIFKSLAGIAGAEHRHKLEVLAELEQRTSRELEGVVARYGIELSHQNAIEGEAFAQKYIGKSYREIMEDWASWIPEYVDLYDRLADMALPADKKALDFLAAHERAINTFISLELLGRSEDALAEITSLLRT